MKRTAEISLIVVGMIVFAFFTLLGGIVIWMQNNRDKVEQFFNETENVNSGFSLEEFERAINEIGNSGWIFTLTLLLAVVVGIAALILLKGNRFPRQAAILLIVSALIFTIVVGIGAGIGGVFYLIAGIVCYVRKEDSTSI